MKIYSEYLFMYLIRKISDAMKNPVIFAFDLHGDIPESSVPDMICGQVAQEIIGFCELSTIPPVALAMSEKALKRSSDCSLMRIPDMRSGSLFKKRKLNRRDESEKTCLSRMTSSVNSL